MLQTYLLNYVEVMIG